jgi:hypothetical protein
MKNGCRDWFSYSLDGLNSPRGECFDYFSLALDPAWALILSLTLNLTLSLTLDWIGQNSF